MVTNSSSTELSSLRQLGVLGIGLIMEEVGKGARLVFRYPASPPPFFSYSRGGQPDMKNNKSNTHTSTKNKKDIGEGDSTTDGSSSSDSIDLFFDLPARVLSKLFRPKRPLCGQPLTLNVSGTTFCCRAELFDSHPSTIGGEGSNHPLVLFSVIVALAPVAPSIRASMAENQSSNNNSMQHKNPLSVEDMRIRHSPNIAVDSTQSRSDAAFITITTIHRNLARLCRVLKREELRCNYVSRQCEMLLQIKKEYELRVRPDCSGSNDSVPNNNNNNSTTADANSKKGDIIPPTSPKGNNTVINSKEQKKTKLISDDDDHDQTNQMSQEQRREYVQDLIENLLAASPSTDNADDDNDEDGDIKLQGNLARELANVFHFISSTTTHSNNNLKREGVVYINRHVAVPLEPIDQLSKTQHQYSIEPHQTLLFPTQTATEVLAGLIDDSSIGINDMSASSSSISQTLCRLLPHIQPRKSLTDIAWDSSVSLPHAMNAATWLINSGICVAAEPILRKNRYKCVDGIVKKMAKMALPFWQTFGLRSQQYKFYWGGEATTRAPHIFVVVSSLTSKRKDGKNISSSPTLGEAFDLLIGRQAESSPHLKRHNSRASSSSLASLNGTSPNEDETAEQVLYSMAVWLIANKVIVLA